MWEKTRKNADKLGVGIAGLGLIAETHVAAIAESDFCYLVAGYHYKKEKADEFATRYSVTVYTDYDLFLDSPLVDFVIIASTSSTHFDLASRAIQKGKPVLIEKPICISSEECDSLVNLSRKYNIPVGGIFKCRYYPAYQLVHKTVSERRLGRIVAASVSVPWFRSNEYYVGRSQSKDGGGVLMIQALHAIDLLLWFCGDIKEVSAYTDNLVHESVDIEDTAVAVVRFTNGALGTIIATTGIYHGYTQRICLYGTEGSIAVEDHQITLWDLKNEEKGDSEFLKSFKMRDTVPDTDTSGIGISSHRDNIDDFAYSIITGNPYMLESEESSKAVYLVNAIYKSSKEKRAVHL